MVELIVIGSSMGGMDAMKALLPSFPASFKTPVVIVQHREETENTLLTEILQKLTPFPVREPDDKDFIQNGTFYIAPSGYHLLINKRSFALSTAPHLNYARPSIDVLFWSATEHYGSSLLGVLLSGAGKDGALGLKQISQNKGLTIVQDPTSAVNPSMPEAALKLMKPDHILPVNKIVQKIIELSRIR